MSREDYVAVAVRLFAVWLFLTILRGGLSAAVAGGELAPWALLLPLPFIGVAAALWFFPLTLAHKLLPAMREPKEPLGAPAREVEVVAFTVLGLWLLAQVISDASYWFILAWQMQREPYEDMAWSADNIASVATTVVELAIALGLLLGTRGLQRLLHRLRGRQTAE